jgi:hypothetical protein
MRLRLLSGIIAISMICAICHAQTSSTPASDEKSLWDIWKMQQEKPDEHGTISTNCLEFAKKAPKDPLSLIVINLAAWHMLKTDNKDAAVKLLKTTLSTSRTDALGTAVANMSKAWLTRIDMEQMKQALQLYYRKNIEYPKSIDLVKPFQKDGQPPLVDRWGKPWAYSLAEFKSLKKLGALYGMYGQKYTLKSVSLGTNSELKAAMTIPYAGGIPLKPVKMLNGMPGKEMVQFESTDGKQAKVVLSIGTDNGGITLNYAGPKLLILSDMNHWLVVPRPY